LIFRKLEIETAFDAGQGFSHSLVCPRSSLQHIRMCCTLQVRVLECSSKTFVHAWLTGKEGLVIDERTNGGGCVADYVLDMLARYPYGYFNRRDHKAYPVRIPTASSFTGQG
jgi:hypothetical protein